jgi:hypothetical protein
MSDRLHYLYWIHDIRHSDVYSQGYVGVTGIGVIQRYEQHLSAAKCGNYSDAFSSALLTSSYTMVETLITGTRNEVLSAEKHLRPKKNIGWNRAIGGDGGLLKHGLTKHPIKPIYYNMFTRAKANNTTVDDVWCGEGGLAQFYKDMGDCPKGYNLTRKDLAGSYGPDNCMWEPRKDFIRRLDHVGNVEYEGKFYTYAELGDLLKVKSNTLQYRLLRGWTVEEAVAGKREGRKILKLSGEETPYNGSLTDAQIRLMAWLRLEGETTISIGKLLNIDCSQISRMCQKIGVQLG